MLIAFVTAAAWLFTDRWALRTPSSPSASCAPCFLQSADSGNHLRPVAATIGHVFLFNTVHRGAALEIAGNWGYAEPRLDGAGRARDRLLPARAFTLAIR